MPAWLTWTLVALAAWLVASIVAGFALGRLFRQSAPELEVDDLFLLESEYWAAASLTREVPEEEASVPQPSGVRRPAVR